MNEPEWWAEYMCREVTLEYGWSDATVPAAARAYCHSQLCSLLPAAEPRDELTDTAGLVVSELVTNAVNAGSSRLEVRLGVHHDHVRLAVGDDAAGLPTVRRATPIDQHGRGLAIVSALSRSWGVERSAFGKHVWVLLPLAAPLTALVPCSLGPLDDT